MIKKLQNISFKTHLLLGLVIRLGLIVYGEIQDEIFEVPYTDIDYKVVTDGARHVLQGSSPFRRHTYRYSPLLAILLIPNLLVHKSFGKIIFSIFDILTAIMIKKVTYNELKTAFIESNKTPTDKKNNGEKKKVEAKKKLPIKYYKWAKNAALFWLYNPFSMVIATRGNGDSISSFFVLATLYCIHKFNSQDYHALLAGIFHGIAIHLRIYPIIFSLPYFLTLSGVTLPFMSNYFWERLLHTIFMCERVVMRPNYRQKLLVLGTALSFGMLTGLFFYLYGMEYLQEAYFYHLTRKDIRHNFSLYFLMQYLGMDLKLSSWGQILMILPRLLLMLYLSITFGWGRKTLSFCIFCQTFVMVTYNPVVTSQYFIWYLSLLPLCFKNLNMSLKNALGGYVLGSLLVQTYWLEVAYFLEFRCFNTFNAIGLGCLFFFIINVGTLQGLICHFELVTFAK